MKHLLYPLFIAAFVSSVHGQATTEWTKKNTFPKGILVKGVGFVIGDKGYAGLGTNNTDFRNDFWQYAPKDDNWEQVEKFPAAARISAVSFSIGPKGYVGTGITGTQNVGKAMNDFWEYDPKKDSWTQKASLPEGARYGAIGFSIGPRGYIGLGMNKTTNYNDMWEYDAMANKWNKRAELPEAGRADASVFVIGHEAFIVAGQGKEIIPTAKDAWKFNAIKNEWKKIAAFPGPPRIGALAFASKSKGFIATGFKALKRYDDFWEYDAAADTWTQKTNLPFGSREYIFALVIGPSAYVCAGYGEKKSTGFDVWEFQLPKEKTPDKFAMGGSLLLGENRIPLAAVEVKILNTKGEVVKSANTGLFGSFLFMDLLNNQEYTLAVTVTDPHWKRQKIYLVNRENETIATLDAENEFKFHIALQEKSKLQLLKIENKNMRMDMRGKLALSGTEKVPFVDAEISLINDLQEVVQVSTTDKDGRFIFNYLPVDTNLYLTIDEKATGALPKGTTILLMDEKEEIINKSTAANAQMLLMSLPPEQNKLSTLYVEDPWMAATFGNPVDGMMVVENVYFNVGKWDLLPEAKAVLNKVIIMMKNNKKINIDVSAHTDSRGDAKSNLSLSEKRAQEARKYITSQGVGAKQITAKGFGESKPLNKCADGVECTEEEHAKNRRMEFKINYSK